MTSYHRSRSLPSMSVATPSAAAASMPQHPQVAPHPPYSPWLDRVKTLLGPRGYDHSMRRSIQTLVIYEAKRCIQPRIGDLRPFQRKVALVDQAQALVHTLDFCLPHHKAEILWRTSTSRETVTPEICWKRYQLIQKELDRLAEQIKPFMTTLPPEHDPHDPQEHHVEELRSHQEAVDMLEQHLFETSGDNQGKSNSGKLVPPNWGHAHNHVLLCFRLYYRGDTLDPDFPDPVPPKHIVVPAVLPKQPSQEHHHAHGRNPRDTTTLTLKNDGDSDALGSHKRGAAAALAMTLPMPNASSSNPSDERRRLLQEVRDHLDLLKEFEGVASEEELNERKKQLYAALPPAPPPFPASGNGGGSASKKQRQGEATALKHDPQQQAFL